MNGTLGVGVDVVDVRRMDTWARRYDQDELALVFTRRELAAAVAARRPGRQLAVCFGAKEAVGKALGLGLVGIDWCDIESTVERPNLRLRLAGRAAVVAGRRGIRRWLASYAVSEPLVMVQVVAC